MPRWTGLPPSSALLPSLLLSLSLSVLLVFLIRPLPSSCTTVGPGTHDRDIRQLHSPLFRRARNEHSVLTLSKNIIGGKITLHWYNRILFKAHFVVESSVFISTAVSILSDETLNRVSNTEIRKLNESRAAGFFNARRRREVGFPRNGVMVRTKLKDTRINQNSLTCVQKVRRLERFLFCATIRACARASSCPLDTAIQWHRNEQSPVTMPTERRTRTRR